MLFILSEMSSAFNLDFEVSGIHGYVMMDGAMPALTEITCTFWMQSTDTTNYGTPISYAVEASDNAFLLIDYNGSVPTRAIAHAWKEYLPWLLVSLSLQLGPLCEREGADHRLPSGEHGSVVPHWGVLAELGRGLENLHQRKALRWRQRPVRRHHHPRWSADFNLFRLS